jgi:hypothetical protein
MPAYSFKERFVPMVLDGSKPHTVRSRRRYFAKKGQTLYLYFGLRTKWAKILREEICTDTHSISICDTHGIVFYSRILTNDELEIAAKEPVNSTLPVDYILSTEQREAFAWRDGFRPEGTTHKKPFGSFYLMLKFWKVTHQLPWAGDIIYWNPSKLKS